MPEMPITDRQVRQYMEQRRLGATQVVAAAKAGFSAGRRGGWKAIRFCPVNAPAASKRTTSVDPFAGCAGGGDCSITAGDPASARHHRSGDVAAAASWPVCQRCAALAATVIRHRHADCAQTPARPRGSLRRRDLAGAHRRRRSPRAVSRRGLPEKLSAPFFALFRRPQLARTSASS